MSNFARRSPKPLGIYSDSPFPCILNLSIYSWGGDELTTLPYHPAVLLTSYHYKHGTYFQQQRSLTSNAQWWMRSKWGKTCFRDTAKQDILLCFPHLREKPIQQQRQALPTNARLSTGHDPSLHLETRSRCNANFAQFLCIPNGSIISWGQKVLKIWHYWKKRAGTIQSSFIKIRWDDR